MVASGIAACLADVFEDGRYTCDVGGDRSCPPGLLCASDGFCRTRDVAPVPAPDAAAPQPDVMDATAPFDACATATWRTSPAGRGPRALAWTTDGHLFAGGTATDKAWLAELDPCDGAVLRETTFDVAGQTKAQVQSIVVSDSEIAFSGTVGDAVTAAWGRHRRDSFAPISADVLTGAGFVGLDHIVRASDGAYWLGGAREIFAPTQAGWIVRVPAVDGGASCELFAGSGVAGLLAGDAGTNVVVNGTDGHSIETLALDPACGLAQRSVVTLGVQRFVSAFHASASRDGALVVGGWGETNDGGLDWGLVGVADGGTLTKAPRLDPNPGRADIVQRGISDGTNVYVGTIQNASITGGSPILYSYALPITETSAPRWATAAYGGRIATTSAMVLGEDDALFVAGSDPTSRTSGVVARCRKSLGCP